MELFRLKFESSARNSSVSPTYPVRSTSSDFTASVASSDLSVFSDLSASANCTNSRASPEDTPRNASSSFRTTSLRRPHLQNASGPIRLSRGGARKRSRPVHWKASARISSKSASSAKPSYLSERSRETRTLRFFELFRAPRARPARNPQKSRLRSVRVILAKSGGRVAHPPETRLHELMDSWSESDALERVFVLKCAF